jgi:hypothetical protein
MAKLSNQQASQIQPMLNIELYSGKRGKITDPNVLSQINTNPVEHIGTPYNPNVEQELQQLSNMPIEPGTPQGWPGVWEDTKNMFSNALPEAGHMLKGALHDIPGALDTITSDAPRATGLVAGAGGANLLRQMLNIAPRALSYLGEKGLINENLGEGARRAKEFIGQETGLQKKLFGEKPGDELLAGMLPFMLTKNPLLMTPPIAALQGANPAAASILAAGGKAAHAGGKYAYEQGYKIPKELKALEEQLIPKEQAAKPFQEKITEAEELYNKALEAEKPYEEEIKLEEKNRTDLEQENNLIKNEYDLANKKLKETKEETGRTTSTKLTSDIEANQEKLNILNEQIKTTPDLSKLPEAEEIYDKSESQITELNTELEALEIELGQHEAGINEAFGKKKTHDIRIAEHIFKEQDAINKEIEGEYKGIHKDLEGVEVDLPIKDNQALNQLKQDLKKAAPNATDAEFKSLLESAAEQLGVGIENKKINANDLINKWRSIRDRGYKLKNDAKFSKDAEQRKLINKEADNALNTANSLFSFMEKTLPKNEFTRLKANNERFKSEVVPVRGNKIWREIERGRKISGADLPAKFRGKEPGTELLQGHILKNPEITELMLGTRHLEKTKNWHEFEELEAPYRAAMSPETAQLLESHRIGLERKTQTEANLKQAQNTANEAEKTINTLSPKRAKQIKAEAEVGSITKELDKAKEDLKKLQEAELPAKESETKFTESNEKLRQQDQIITNKKLEQKGAKQQTASQKRALSKAEKRGKMNLQELAEHQEKIKEKKAQISKLKSRLMGLGKHVGKVAVVKDILKMLFTG